MQAGTAAPPVPATATAAPRPATLRLLVTHTMTGGRLKRVTPYIADEDAFCFTYGDGLSNLDIAEAVRFHRRHGSIATVTAVQPQGRYGALDLDDDGVRRFIEKPSGDGGWINGGYFVLSPKALDYIDGDSTAWELAPLEKLAAAGELKAFRHKGFWHAMDTLRDKMMLEELWRSGNAPWRVWP